MLARFSGALRLLFFGCAFVALAINLQMWINLCLAAPVPSSIGNGGGGGGGGTVTAVSVASVNGFSGTVANPSTTPAITIIPSGPGVTDPAVCPDTSNSATALVCSTSPSFTLATNNSVVLVVGTSPNSGSTTVNVNGSGAKVIRKTGGSATLAANDLLAGQRVQLVYDGTNWQMLSQVGNASAGLQNLFSSIPVAGQTTVTAVTPTTALTFKNGANMTITTNNVTKEITFTSSGGGGGGSISSGTFAALPAAGSVGAVYLFTDSCFEQGFDDGTDWNFLSDGLRLVNPSGLSWVNQGSATSDVTRGGDIMTTPSAGGTNLKMRVANIGHAAPYTVTTRFAINFGLNSFPTGGLVMRDSATGKVELFTLYGSNSYTLHIQAFKNNGPTGSFDGNYFDDLYSIGASRYIWFRVDDDATNKCFQYSFDGVSFKSAGCTASTGYITADQYGIFVQSQGSVSSIWFHSLKFE